MASFISLDGIKWRASSPIVQLILEFIELSYDTTSTPEIDPPAPVEGGGGGESGTGAGSSGGSGAGGVVTGISISGSPYEGETLTAELA